MDEATRAPTPESNPAAPLLTRRSAVAMAAAGVLLPDRAARADAPRPTRVLVVVGPSNHPPGTHEVAAGGRLVAHCLGHAAGGPGIRAEVVSGWPAGPDATRDAAAVVFIGDRFPPEELPGRDRVMKALAGMMDRGCGIVCLHFATGLNGKQVAADGDHPLLRWLGGYYASGCPHHRSVARVFPEAKVEPAAGDHPVLRGWRAFTVHDEPYIRNYFGPHGPGKAVTPLATAMLPPEAPRREVVAWAVARPDGGRGVGVVMPHFYRNWGNDDLRTLILNGIVWAAGGDVPTGGVRVKLPALSAFEPEAVDPVPRPKK